MNYSGSYLAQKGLLAMELNKDLSAWNALLNYGQTIWSVITSYVSLYLCAIVAANLLVARFGPTISIINAFLFIGLDLKTRDNLHDSWQYRGLWWKMALLILSGSVLSWLLNRQAARIAIASFVAFMASGIADTIVYTILHRKERMARINWSNFGGAAVDSLIFPSLAFGFPPDWWICYGQFTAKVAGGLFWSLILK